MHSGHRWRNVSDVIAFITGGRPARLGGFFIAEHHFIDNEITH